MFSMIKNSLEKYFPSFIENDEVWNRFSNRVNYIKVDINLDNDWKNINNVPDDRGSHILFGYTTKFI